MPTYAQARQAVSDAASPYLVQIRRLLEMAGLLSASGLDDGKVLPASVAAGLYGCGITPADPLLPADGDLTKLAGADWPRFLALAELHALTLASGAFAVMPKVIQYGANEVRQEFDTAGLRQLVDARRAAIEKQYPLAVRSSVTKGWLTVGRRTDADNVSEF